MQTGFKKNNNKQEWNICRIVLKNCYVNANFELITEVENRWRYSEKNTKFKCFKNSKTKDQKSHNKILQ